MDHEIGGSVLKGLTMSVKSFPFPVGYRADLIETKQMFLKLQAQALLINLSLRIPEGTYAQICLTWLVAGSHFWA